MRTDARADDCSSRKAQAGPHGLQCLLRRPRALGKLISVQVERCLLMVRPRGRADGVAARPGGAGSSVEWCACGEMRNISAGAEVLRVRVAGRHFCRNDRRPGLVLGTVRLRSWCEQAVPHYDWSNQAGVVAAGIESGSPPAPDRPSRRVDTQPRRASGISSTHRSRYRGLDRRILGAGLRANGLFVSARIAACK